MKPLTKATLIALMLSTSNGFADLNRGLVAYYPFNGNANDESGHGNNGLAVGATLTSDMIGNNNSAYYFNGTSDYISITNPKSIPTGNSARTVSAWINSYGPTDGDKYQSIVSWGNMGTFNQGFALERGGAPYPDNIYYNKLFVLGWWNDFAGKKIITYNKWHHVAAVFNGKNLTLYVNGVKDGATAKNYNTQLNEYGLLLGLSPPNDGWHMHFNGVIDDVRLYNRALGPLEIQQLYRIGQAISGSAIGYSTINVTCSNVSTGKSIQFTTTNRISSSWNCEKQGLIVKSGDQVDVLLSGTAHK